MNWQRDIEVLTPLFNRGAYQDTPEIRVPSIRGMVRWWFRALEYQDLPGSDPARRLRLQQIADDEKQVFGGVHGRATASRLVIRISNVRTQRAVLTPTLPHKQGGQASPQAAFPAGACFRLEVFSRLGPLPDRLREKVEGALEVWLLLGALGLRANRSGGSVWPTDGIVPATPAALRARLTELSCRWPVMLAGTEVGFTPDQLRAAATDTVNGAAWVFGYARGRERLASALKFKIVRFEDQFRLLVTAQEQPVLEEARRALRGHRSKPETWQPL